jgi:hypothetical protein
MLSSTKQHLTRLNLFYIGVGPTVWRCSEIYSCLNVGTYSSSHSRTTRRPMCISFHSHHSYCRPWNSSELLSVNRGQTVWDVSAHMFKLLSSIFWWPKYDTSPDKDWGDIHMLHHQKLQTFRWILVLWLACRNMISVCVHLFLPLNVQCFQVGQSKKL